MNKRLCILVILLVFISSLFYYTSHQKEFLVRKADKFYKNGDIVSAQNALEKAFLLGYEDSTHREIYVKSIINAPLDTEAQEKLKKFLEYNVEDVSSLNVQYFFSDLKREIYKKYPDNYIISAVHNGKILHWGKLPITYGFINSSGVPEYFIDEIETAFLLWEKALDKQLIFQRDDNNPDIIINFNSVTPVGEKSQKYVVAYTVPDINLNHLKHMQINFYLKDAQNEFFTPNQIYNTALHEIVHALGFMGHSDDRDNIMYLSKDSKTVAEDLREVISRADINTVKLLYKIKPDITNADEIQSEYIPYLILGSSEVVSENKLKEAEHYVKRAPSISSGYMDMAEVYVEQKEFDKAVKSLNKALKLAENDEVRNMIYYNLAVSYYYLNQPDSAISYLKKSIELSDTEEKHYLLAEIYSLCDTESSIKEYKKLLDKNPLNIEYVIGLTNIYINQKKYISARNVLKTYFKNNPSERNNPRLKNYGILKLGL